MAEFESPAEAEWHRMISQAAYYLAAKRGFEPGKCMQDWLEAEAQIKKELTGQ